MCVPTAHSSRNVSNEALWNHLVTTMFEKAKQKLKTTCKTLYGIFLNENIWTYSSINNTSLSPQYVVWL